VHKGHSFQPIALELKVYNVYMHQTLHGMPMNLYTFYVLCTHFKKVKLKKINNTGRIGSPYGKKTNLNY
jgi:hypothetical protein